MKTLIGFFFDTGSGNGQYYQVWIVAECDQRIEREIFHSIVNSGAFSNLNLDEDEEYEDIAESIMNESVYNWASFAAPANGIDNIFTFFL